MEQKCTENLVLFHNPCAPTSIPREAYFPTFGSTTTSKMAAAAREFHVMRVDVN